MADKIIVTGVNGFVGRHVVNELSRRDIEIFGVGREVNANNEIAAKLVKYFSCDLTDVESVKLLDLNKVIGVINLAGLAQVGASFAVPEKYTEINVAVFEVLAKRILSENLDIRVIAVSTGAVYSPNQTMPLKEDSSIINSSSPYAASKVEMEKHAEQSVHNGLNCIIVRPFNHIGPGQKSGFLVPDLYKKLLKARENYDDILVGNLDTRRDYTDVRDVARAYVDLLTSADLTNKVYNICSGKSVSGQEILDVLLHKMNLTGKIRAVADKSIIRPSDPLELYGDNSRIKKDTGWQASFSLEQTIGDFVDFHTEGSNL